MTKTRWHAIVFIVTCSCGGKVRTDPASTDAASDLVVLNTKLTANDGAERDFFGSAVCVSGDTVVIGANGADDRGYQSGAAYVFTAEGSGWRQQQKLVADDGEPGTGLGTQLSVSGNTIVVGADGEQGNTSAYVFTKDGLVWRQQQKLTIEHDGLGANAGFSLSVSGDTVVIGVKCANDLGECSGSAYVFARHGLTWSLQQKLMANDGTDLQYFGSAVSASGDTVLIGAYGDDSNGQLSGATYVFVREGSTWNQRQKLVAADGKGGDFFGISVSVFGNTALIGAEGDDDHGESSGSAYVFVREGSVWSEQQKLTATDGAREDLFGHSVSSSEEVAVVGAARGHFSRDGSGTGFAYVFARDRAGWSQRQKILPVDSEPNDKFGYQVSASASTLVVGAHFDDDEGKWSGSAYVFDL